MSSNSNRPPTFAPCGPEGRRPERIDELLSALAVYWHQYPQQRLGQIIYHFARVLALKMDYNISQEAFVMGWVRDLEDDALLGMITTGMPYPEWAADQYLESIGFSGPRKR